jgi:hypothetical protein
MAGNRKPKKGEETPGNPKAATLPVRVGEGETMGQKSAQAVAGGGLSNAAVTFMFAQHSGIIAANELGDLAREFERRIEQTKAGGTEHADEMLTSQASTLNAIFLEMARRASINMNSHLEATEVYLRLALKAQSQCRATLESLSEIRNPRSVAFVRQANIANNQQVNNGQVEAAEGVPESREETSNPPSKLLESNGNVTRLDARATGKTGRRDTDLEAVGTIYGAKVG